MNTLESRLVTALADHQVFYQKVRSYHWLVSGPQFFTLHPQFEALYNDLAETGDALAERIAAIGARPVLTLGEAVTKAAIAEGDIPARADDMVRAVVTDFGTIRSTLYDALAAAHERNDVATTSLLEGIVERHEKSAWMFRSVLPDAAGNIDSRAA